MEEKTIKLLLVENNSVDAELVKKLLSTENNVNFSLQQAENFDSAIAILAQNNFDGMLLNLSLAQNINNSCKSNLDTLKQQAPQVAIIVLSATEDPDQALQVILQGAQDCLNKQELKARILIRSIKYAIARQRQEFNTRQQAVMKKMLDQIRSSINLESILETSATVIQEFLQSDQVLIYRCDSEQCTETTVFSQSVDDELENRAVEQFMNAINFSDLYSILAKSTSVQAVTDTYAESTAELQVIAPQDVRSYLILPIWLEQSKDDSDDFLSIATPEKTIASEQKPELWGMLVAYNIAKTRHWQDWEIRFLQRLTTQVTIAIQQSQLYGRLQSANQKLKRLAILDGLTGIANRRYFDLVLNQEWQRLAREQQPLSLILCDIDYFKAYNDTYGHQQGDLCLQQVAAILQDSTRRPADLVARYGGEEFALILPNTPAPGALFLAHRIVRELTRQGIPHQQSQVSNFLTLSMGIATKIPQPKQPSSTIIEAADNLLYKAKQAGRNQLAMDNWVTSPQQLGVPSQQKHNQT